MLSLLRGGGAAERLLFSVWGVLLAWFLLYVSVLEGSVVLRTVLWEEDEEEVPHV